MRYSSNCMTLLVFLTVTACYSSSEHDSKRPPIRVERPEISFDLMQVSNGVVKIRMTNNGKVPFRYYDSLVPTKGHHPFFPTFRLCDRALAECGGEEWINPNLMISSFIALPVDLSELEAGGSMTKAIDITHMLAGGGVYEPKPGDRLQIRFDVMLTPYFEEYIEYVSEWVPVETLTRP